MSPPRLIVGDRQTGRTTDLIKMAAEDEAHGVVCYIVCHSQEECYRISEFAQQMNLQIGFPITYEEFIDRAYDSKNIDKFYIDNLRMFLASICPIPIEAMVW